jgi:hypothetical protein
MMFPDFPMAPFCSGMKSPNTAPGCPRFQNLGKGVAFNVGSSKTHQKTLTLSCLKSSRNTEMDIE